MTTEHTPDHQAQIIKLMLMILGLGLLAYGWYQWAT
jgi:hypothetical protein